MVLFKQINFFSNIIFFLLQTKKKKREMNASGLESSTM